MNKSTIVMNKRISGLSDQIEWDLNMNAKKPFRDSFNKEQKRIIYEDKKITPLESFKKTEYIRKKEKENLTQLPDLTGNILRAKQTVFLRHNPTYADPKRNKITPLQQREQYMVFLKNGARDDFQFVPSSYVIQAKRSSGPAANWLRSKV